MGDAADDAERKALQEIEEEGYPTDAQPEPSVTDKLEEQENTPKPSLFWRFWQWLFWRG